MSTKYVSLAELSRGLGLPRIWLKSQAAAGRIPSVRVGDRLKFRPDAVEQAMLQRAQIPEAVEEVSATQ